MAFATSNVRKCSLGGNLKLTVGEWSGAVGDAAGSLVVEGGKVYHAKFLTNKTSGSQDVEVRVSPSTSGALTTISVYNNATVTAGTFSVIHA